MEDDADLLAEQRAYYRARAPEYDEWWQRRGRYDRGGEERAEWDRQVAVLDEALASFGATGRVLELAGGTGWWTERLARTADDLTVVDASAETLEQNRARIGRDDVTYVQADLFDWRPEQGYDVVFFSFWLSHVPRARFGEFWSLVRECLAPGGRAFLIDNREDPQPTSPAKDPPAKDPPAKDPPAKDPPAKDPPAKDPYVFTYEPDLHRRRLADGTEWRVVKVMYEPDELHALLEAEGWRPRIDAARWFIHGSAEPA